MKKKIIILLCAICMCFSGCSQELARGYGGTFTLDLEPGEKLIEITWKDAGLWYLTRPFRDGEEAETYEFKESSNYGIWEGTVIIIEHK